MNSGVPPLLLRPDSALIVVGDPRVGLQQRSRD